jgi:hypothetical protein
LGVLNILGVEHLMVLIGKEEVCKVYHRHQNAYDRPSVIFELQEIEIVPFQASTGSSMLDYQLKNLRDGIKKFLECGFYIAHKFDLTSNAQRREKFATVAEDGTITSDSLASVDKRYMWNYNLYKHLRT